MGIDLAFLPVDGDHPARPGYPDTGPFFSHIVLPISRSPILKDIREVADEHSFPLPQPLWTYMGSRPDGETGYGAVFMDPHGAALQYVLARDLKPLASLVGVHVNDEALRRISAWARIKNDTALTPTNRSVKTDLVFEATEDNYSSKNLAAFAYVCALPDNYKIVLFWH